MINEKEIIDSIKKGNYGSVYVFLNKNAIDFDFRYECFCYKKLLGLFLS